MNCEIEKNKFIAEVAYTAYRGYVELIEQEVQTERRWWVRELNLHRDEEGFFALNFNQMKDKDPEHFFKMTRMSPKAFQILRALTEAHLQKTNWRKPIEPMTGYYTETPAHSPSRSTVPRNTFSVQRK